MEVFKLLAEAKQGAVCDWLAASYFDGRDSRDITPPTWRDVRSAAAEPWKPEYSRMIEVAC